MTKVTVNPSSMQAMLRFARSTALRPCVADLACGGLEAARGLATSATQRLGGSSGLDAFLDPRRFMAEDKAKEEVTGREWLARELRLKSFEDLHALWYVLLKEKNMLQTEKYVHKANRTKMRNKDRLGKVRRAMSRIKHVLSERAQEDAGDCMRTRRRFMNIINAK